MSLSTQISKGPSSRRAFLGSATGATLACFAKPILAEDEPGVPYKMITQSAAFQLPTERLNNEIAGLPGALRFDSTIVIPESCFNDPVNLRPSENWYGTGMDAKQFGLNLGAFCLKNKENEVLDRLEKGAKAAECVLTLLTQVVEESVALEILAPLGGALSLVLLALIIQQYRQDKVDKKMYKEAVKLADKIFSTTAQDPKSYLFRAYYLTGDSEFLEETIFFQGSTWKEGHPLWTAKYRKKV